ncbi:efflux RND transporter permease subunit [Halalkalibacterium halodurans]|uniref:efflux RND transporter permease subunit n=1 Tax=Halalkalibacterium halodurans TaxID=86665 RepID=UPI002AAA52C9|nr:efflux RND transporter permease subunit [Halalkalibacterium halodurans]MDY7224320.1 efflux RND transporter permease subunit [Halalkalibacterium halodurans]MDY7243605.1 efflux RND transporter permease subunit [Halalkalibacterium halodurans]
MTQFSIRRPVFTIVGMIIFLLVGGISYVNLPLQLTPDLNPPIGAVTASYPGASAEEVSENVTRILEDELSTTSGLNKITSQSMEGSAIIILEFGWTTNIDDVENDIISTINRADLPDGASNPSFLKFDPSAFPIMELVVTSDTEAISDISEALDELEREIGRVEGVASVSSHGRLMERVEVTIDDEALEEANLTQQDVVDVIEANDISLPGGTISDGDRSLTTRTIRTLDAVETIEDLVLTIDTQTGDDVLLSDVADVSISLEDETVITRANNDPAVQFSIMKEDAANSVDVSVAITERLDELLEQDRFDDVSAFVLYDEGDFILEAINNVLVALIAGATMAMVVLFLFLRNFKTPLIIGIAIPFSVIVTFAFLYFTNVSLNILSLGGLALGIGMLVDNSIVVIENIYRHLSMGKEPKQAALEGTREVRGAITASTLTTISVFVPILFLTGLVGELFIQFALTVSLSLFASLLVAITLVPLMASRLLRKFQQNEEAKRQQSRFILTIERSIKWALRHRAMVLIATLLLFVGGLYGLSTVGVDFLEDMDEGLMVVEIEHEPGTSLERTRETVEAIEQKLEDYSEIENFVSTSGARGTNVGRRDGNSYEGQVQATLVPSSDRDLTTLEFVESIKRDVERVDSDAEINVSPLSLQGSEPNTLTFYLSDSDPDRLEEATEALEEELLERNEVTNLELSIDVTTPEYQLLIDEEAARENGLVPAQVAQFVYDVTLGQTVTTLEIDNDLYDLFVRYHPDVLDSLETMEELTIRNNEGVYVPLGDVVTIEEGEGPATINRIEQRDAVEFTVMYDSSLSLGDISSIVLDIVDEQNFEDTTEFAFTGDQEALETAMADLTGAFMLAVVFVFLVMAAQFESFRFPFVVMFSLPLVMIGVSLALLVTGTSFSVMAGIGMIILAGIVVNNAIVIVDYMNQLKASGATSYEAIVEAVKQRTRPVLMTALTTILGVLPLALALGEGTEMQRPIGLTVIGGLISGTFLTLFVIPVIYSLFDKDTRRLNKTYITPDGELIPARLLQERKQLEAPEPEGEEVSQEQQESVNEAPENQKESKSEDGLSKDELVSLLEQLIEQTKGRSNKKD